MRDLVDRVSQLVPRPERVDVSPVEWQRTVAKHMAKLEFDQDHCFFTLHGPERSWTIRLYANPDVSPDEIRIVPARTAVDDGELVLMLADRLGARVLAMIFSRIRVRRGAENLEIWLDCGFDSWWSTATEVEARVAKLLKLDELEMLVARDVLGAIFGWPRSRRTKESLR